MFNYGYYMHSIKKSASEQSCAINAIASNLLISITAIEKLFDQRNSNKKFAQNLTEGVRINDLFEPMILTSKSIIVSD